MVFSLGTMNIDKESLFVIAVAIVAVAVQVLFAVKCERALISALPALSLAIASGVFITIAYFGSGGWDAVGYLLIGMLALALAALTAVVCIICRILRRIIN